MSWVLAHLLLLAFLQYAHVRLGLPVALRSIDGNFGISLAMVVGFVSCGCMCATYSTELIDQIHYFEIQIIILCMHMRSKG